MNCIDPAPVVHAGGIGRNNTSANIYMYKMNKHLRPKYRVPFPGSAHISLLNITKGSIVLAEAFFVSRGIFDEGAMEFFGYDTSSGHWGF